MDAVVDFTADTSPPGRRRLTRLLAWQGLRVATPTDWELTGFSGTRPEGYFRADDSDALALECKWSTPKIRASRPVDLEERRNAFLSALRKAARRRRVEFKESETDPPRSVLRANRDVVGFAWSADRKARGVLWHCRDCGRVVMAQVLGEPSGRKGFASAADAVLGSLECHGDDPDWVRWSLYDLCVDVPKEYELLSAQLMNVYLRLTFQQGAGRLSVEQWSLANVARGERYLDEWFASNSRAEIRRARYGVETAEVSGHPAVRYAGGLAIGLPSFDALREAASLRVPATRFSAVAWECPDTNKIHAVQAFRPLRTIDPVAKVAARVRCHDPGCEDDQ